MITFGGNSKPLTDSFAGRAELIQFVIYRAVFGIIFLKKINSYFIFSNKLFSKVCIIFCKNFFSNFAKGIFGDWNPSYPANFRDKLTEELDQAKL